ncbi:hypothetical protein C8J57DRAFT_1521371 [Mycena rebaudengoi]|nr:hypothetical protein C8J57DRAFT_1562957 [Mycena rebaudengoi]KAJ7250368.1 hypothetical protein C8J57DRAFT_1521371 [Mycena rebaudengoi]
MQCRVFVPVVCITLSSLPPPGIVSLVFHIHSTVLWGAALGGVDLWAVQRFGPAARRAPAALRPSSASAQGRLRSWRRLLRALRLHKRIHPDLLAAAERRAKGTPAQRSTATAVPARSLVAVTAIRRHPLDPAPPWQLLPCPHSPRNRSARLGASSPCSANY